MDRKVMVKVSTERGRKGEDWKRGEGRRKDKVRLGVIKAGN